MEISRCHLTDYVKILHQKACRTCSTIIFPHSANHIIDLQRCCCRCRRHFLRPWQTRTHCGHHKCFPVCPRAQHLLRTQILFPGNKKCFWFFSETFCVRNKCFPVCAAWKHNIHFVSCAFARPRKIMSNNVSSFARALRIVASHTNNCC